MKKLFKIGVLILMMIPSMFFVACKSKVKQISASNVKTEFYYGEDFSLGDVEVTVTYKNKKQDKVNLSDLSLNMSDSTYSNSTVIIDFSNYNAERPGNYDIVVSYVKDKKINYSYTVTVSQKQFSEDDYQVANYVGEYDGRNHSINVTTSIEGATIKYGISESNCTLSELSFRQAGRYTIYFKIEKTGYSSSATGSGTVTIAKKTLEITPKQKTIAFGQSFQGAGFTATGFVGTDSKDDLSGNAIYTSDYTGERIGTYQINMSGLTSSNYDIKYNPGVLIVEKANNNLQITIPQTQYGTALNPTVISNPSKLEIDYQYSIDREVWVDGLPENIGEYFVKASTPDSENYGPASVVVQTSITARQLTITAKNVTIEYNSEYVFNPDTDVVYDGFVPGQDKSDLDGTLIGHSDYRQGQSGVGEYTIVVEGYSSSTNYNIQYVFGTLTVTPAKNVLDVTIENVVYGEKLTPVVNQNLSNYTVNYKYLSSIQGSNWITNTLPKNAGTYTIIASTEARGNFQYTECVIENVVIEKKTLNFTCENAEIKFNEYYVEGRITDANFNGFVNNETMSVLSGVFGYTSNYSRGNDSGEYTINLICNYGNSVISSNNNIAQNNYKLEVQTGILTVDKADGSVQASINNITYGESFEVGKNIVVTNNLSMGEVSFAYKTIEASEYIEGLPTQAGFYDIRVISGETKNYKLSYDDSARGIEVKKKLLTVTPNNYEVTYNQEIDENSQYNGVVVEGFIEGEDISVLTLENEKLHYTTEYVKGSPVRSTGYKLNVTGYVSDNYSIKYNSGKIIVNKAQNVVEVTLNDVVYGERPNPTRITNLAEQEDSSAVVNYRYSKDGDNWYQTRKDAGEYYVRVSTKETTNYLPYDAVLEVKQVISKRVLTVTPSEIILKYKQSFEFRKVKYTYDSFAYDDSIYTLDGSLSLYTIDYVCDEENNIYTLAGADAGFTVSGFEESANYTFDYKPGKITIIPAETNLAVTIPENNRIENGVSYVEYNGTEVVISTYSESGNDVITSYQSADETDENIWANGLPKDSGSYRIKVISPAVEGKYDQEELIKLVTIEKRNIVITPNYIELKYGSVFADNGVKTESTIIGKNPFAQGEDLTVLDGEIIYTSDYHKGSDANLADEFYTVYVSESTLSGINYNITYKSGLLKVNKADNTLKPTMIYNNENNRLYYGDEINIELVDKNSDGAIKIEYKVVGTGDITYTEEVPVNYGNYMVRITQSATRNFVSSQSTINFAINKKVIELLWGENEFTYDGYPHIPTVEITNLLEGDECEFTVVGEKVNAGEYVAYVDRLTNNNYTLGEVISKEFIINKVVVYEPTITSVVYNGNTQTAVVADTDFYTVKENDGGINAGSYPVELLLRDPVNYKWSTTGLENKILSFEITKANNNVLYFNGNVLTEGDNIDYNFDYNSPVTQTVTSLYGNVETLYKKVYETEYVNTIPTDCSYYYTYNNGEEIIVDKTQLYTTYDVKYIVHDSVSYNTVEFRCSLTINKIDPTYILTQNIFADKYFASGYETELYTLALPADANGKWKWASVNDVEYNAEYEGAHYIVPGYMENGEYVDGYVSETLYYIPIDTTNYNTLEFTANIYAYNNRLKTFDDGEIFIANKDVLYDLDGYSIDVVLSGKATGAIVKYSQEYDGEYLDTNPVVNAVNDETHIGNYTIYVKVTKTVELAKNVYQTYESDILSGNITITDYINTVILTSYNHEKAIMKGETLDISDITFRAEYMASNPVELTGADFVVVNLNTTTVGEKDVSVKLISTGKVYENMFKIYVYEDFVEGFAFNFGSMTGANSITASRTGRRQYQASFTEIDHLSFYSNVSLLGTVKYNAYVATINQELYIDEGYCQVTYYLDLVVGNNYTDQYAVTLNLYINEFVYSIVDSATPVQYYDSVNDKYVFEYVTSNNYSQLAANYGEITGLYNPDTTEFNDETNLIINNKLENFKFKDYPSLIVEKTYGVFVYRSLLEFNVLDLPIKQITVNGIDYICDNSNRTIELKVHANQEILAEFGDLDSQYELEVYSATESAELSGNNITYTMRVTAEELLEGKTYSFTVCKENGSDHIHLQYITINLNLEDYIESFTIETDSKVYDLNDTPSITISNEFIKSVNIDVEDGFTYELYINGELTTIDNFVLYADKTYGTHASFINNIALKVTNNAGITAYAEYNIVCLYENSEILYNQGENYADTEFDYHNLTLYSETGMIRLVNSIITETEDTYTLKVNGDSFEFGDEITLAEGINDMVVTVEREGYMPVVIKAYFFGSSDTYKYITSMSDTSVFGSYSIYHKGEYVGTFMAAGYSVEIDSTIIVPSDFVIKNSSNAVLSDVTVALDNSFITLTVEYQGVTYVSIIKATFKNIVKDDVTDATFFLVDSARKFESLVPDSNNTVSIKLKSGDQIFVSLINKGARITSNDDNLNGSYLTIIGNPGETGTVEITITSSDRTVSETYYFEYEIEEMKLLTLVYTDSDNADAEKFLLAKQTLYGTEYSGDLMMTYPEDDGVINLVMVDKLSAYPLYNQDGTPYTSGDQYVKVTLNGYYEDTEAYKTVDYNVLLTTYSYTDSVSDKYSSTEDMLLKLETDDSNTYYSVYVLMNNVLYRVVVYTVADTDTITNIEFTINYTENNEAKSVTTNMIVTDSIILTTSAREYSKTLYTEVGLSVGSIYINGVTQYGSTYYLGDETESGVGIYSDSNRTNLIAHSAYDFTYKRYILTTIYDTTLYNTISHSDGNGGVYLDEVYFVPVELAYPLNVSTVVASYFMENMSTVNNANVSITVDNPDCLIEKASVANDGDVTTTIIDSYSNFNVRLVELGNINAKGILISITQNGVPHLVFVTFG